MRVLSTWLVAVMAALTIAGCSGGSSSSSSDNGATSSASDTTSSAADNSMSTASSTATEASPASGGAMGSTDIPSYPGATTEAEGSSSNMMGGAKSAAGKVMTTADSFDKVYAWYQKNMPAGSEKAHTTAPVQSAVFMLGEAGKDQQSVTISVAGGKTTITIAKVKM